MRFFCQDSCERGQPWFLRWWRHPRVERGRAWHPGCKSGTGRHGSGEQKLPQGSDIRVLVILEC